VNKDLQEQDRMDNNHSNKDNLKQILGNLKPMVSNQHHFNKYLDNLISGQHKVLEQASDMATVHRAQGSIYTLQKLKLLREEVNGKNKT
jgi:hypothetical protein